MNSVVLKVWAFDICLMLTFELRKTLGKARFSGKDAKTKYNLSKKKYLGEFKNHRRGFMVLFWVIIRTRDIWSQGKDILNVSFVF